MIRNTSKLWKSAVLATMLALAVRDVEAGGRGFGGGFSARPSSSFGGSSARGNSSFGRSSNSGFSNNNSGFRATRSNNGNNYGNTTHTVNRPVTTYQQPVSNTYRNPVNTVANTSSTFANRPSSLPKTVLPTLNRQNTGSTNTASNSAFGRRNGSSLPSLPRSTKSFTQGPLNGGIASRFPKGLKTADAGSMKDSLLKRMTGNKPNKNLTKAAIAAGVTVAVLDGVLNAGNSGNSGDVIVDDVQTSAFVDNTPVIEAQNLPDSFDPVAAGFIDNPIQTVSAETREYTLLIFNMTEQPMTYSIRAEGTQWGTYTLDAGQHHRFTVPQDAMEVQYANSTGSQLVSLPGEHVYAFADLDGKIQICNADPDGNETAAN